VYSSLEQSLEEINLSPAKDLVVSNTGLSNGFVGYKKLLGRGNAAAVVILNVFMMVYYYFLNYLDVYWR